MPEIDDIRRGLAANLRSIPDCGVSAYFKEAPDPPMLQVVGFANIDYLEQSHGDPGGTLLLVIEGVSGRTVDIGAQMLFDQWLNIGGPRSVKDAIESDYRLTSRMRDNGTVVSDQEPACDSLVVQSFQGYRRGMVGTVAHLLGEWVVQVETSG